MVQSQDRQKEIPVEAVQAHSGQLPSVSSYAESSHIVCKECGYYDGKEVLKEAEA